MLLPAVAAVSLLYLFMSVAPLTEHVNPHSEIYAQQTQVLSETVQRRSVKDETTLDIWICEALSAEFYRAFTSVELIVNQTNGDSSSSVFQIYQNQNLSMLLEDVEENRRFFGIFRKVALWRSKQLQPFGRTYIGIETGLPYEISIRIWHIDFIRVLCFSFGLILLVFAKDLAKNALFYYTSGCGIGVLASLLILVFVVYRFLPKQSVAYSVLIGGWSFSLYILYSIWRNLHSILMLYQKWVAIYLVTVVLISFAICYRRGPPVDSRSQNLSQWTLQLFSILLIYNSCQVPELSAAVVVMMVVMMNFPSSLWIRLAAYWQRLFPPRVRLLTDDEYRLEGERETAKALAELRAYCQNSPGNASWRIVSRLQSPMKFADFVEGGSHLEDDVDEDEEDSSLYPNFRSNSKRRPHGTAGALRHLDVEEFSDSSDEEFALPPTSSRAVGAPRGRRKEAPINSPNRSYKGRTNTKTRLNEETWTSAGGSNSKRFAEMTSPKANGVQQTKPFRRQWGNDEHNTALE